MNACFSSSHGLRGLNRAARLTTLLLIALAAASAWPAFARPAPDDPAGIAAIVPIQMADGSIKPVEFVKAGDLVRSRNPQTGKTKAEPVLAVAQRQVERLVDLRLQSGESITCAEGTPFYVQGKGFVQAGRLVIGNTIATGNGQRIPVVGIVWQPMAERVGLVHGYTVFDLSVAVDHCYFIGRARRGVAVQG